MDREFAAALVGGRLTTDISAQASGEQSKTYEAQLFPLGQFIDPRDPFMESTLSIDEAYLDNLVANYENDVIGAPVQIVYGSHDPDLNTAVGNLISVEKRLNEVNADHNGLWGRIRIDDPEVSAKIDNGDVAAISVRIIPDFQSSRLIGGKPKETYGPTLRHVAIVDVGHFEDMVNMTPVDASKFDKNGVYVVPLRANMVNSNLNANRAGDSKMDEITKDITDKLTDEQLADFGLQRVDEGNDPDPTPQEPTKESEETKEPEGTTTPATNENDEQIQAARNEALKANRELAQMRLNSQIQANRNKFSAKQLEAVKAQVTKIGECETSAELEATSVQVASQVDIVCQGPDVVTMGENGSADGVNNDEVKASEKELKDISARTGISVERLKELNEKHDLKGGSK